MSKFIKQQYKMWKFKWKQLVNYKQPKISMPQFYSNNRNENYNFFKFISIFIIINIIYFFVYYFFLQQRISFLNFSFYILTLFLYVVFSNLTNKIYLRIPRLILVMFFIVFCLINFLHFKNLGSFLVLGKGYVQEMNLPMISLLSNFLYQAPFILIISSLILFLNFLWFDYKTSKVQYNFFKNFVLVFLCILTIIGISFYNIKNPSPAWSSVTVFHSEFGPVGYFYLEFFKKRISKKPAVSMAYDFNGEKSNYLLYTKNSLKNLSLLKEKKFYVKPPLPKFIEMPRIIFYQLESTSMWAVNQNPTPMPFLKKLMEENITVDQFFSNDCHTIGSEFASLCSLLPDSRNIISARIDPPDYECLPEILSKRFGYSTEMYHSNVPSFWNRDKLAPGWGIEKMYFSPYFKPKASDEIVVTEMVRNMLEKNNPVFTYFIGYTSHAPHTEDNMYLQLVENQLKIKPYAYELNSTAKNIELPQNELKNYLGFLTAEDEALKKMFTNLERTGELDNSIIVIFGDHRYYGFKNNNIKFLSEFNELPFVMYVPGMGALKIPIVASHMDIAPTILNLISEIDVDTKTHYIGQSIFSNNHFNQAVSKCGDEVSYFNSEVALVGDFGLNVYSMTKKPFNLSSEIEKEYYTRLNDVVYFSDELVGYPNNFIFPDGALVKGSLNSVFIIDRGKKRFIPNEDIFHAMGFSWNDIHKISDKWLAEYETSNNLTLEDTHLAKKPIDKNGSIIEKKSVLRPSSNTSNNSIIAHALGGIEGASGTNSREAFIENYKKGIRFFEVDLSLTTDGAVVAFHDGNEANIGLDKKISQTTLKEFKQQKFFDKYSLLDFKDILDLMREYPDAYIITDTKGDLQSMFSKMVFLAENYYPESLNRIIPQIYKEGDLEIIKRFFNFKDIIYTLYRIDDSDNEVIRFVKSNAQYLTGVTMWWDKRFNKNIKDQLLEVDVNVFVHTVNDEEVIKDFIKMGVGVYTDFYANK